MFPRKSGCCSFCHKKTAWQNCNNPLSPGPTSAIPRPAERPGFPPCLPRRGGGAKSQRPGGGGGARSALKERTRGQGPRARSFVWQAGGSPAGRPRPPNAAAPARTPRRPPPPSPACIHRQYGGVPGGAGRPGGHAGAAAFCGPKASKTAARAGAKGPRPCGVGASRPRRPGRPPVASANPKEAAKSQAPRGAWPIKRRQEGTRQRLYPLDKAAAHALRAAAAYTAPPRATAASRQQPLLRDYRRPRRAAVRVAPWQRGGRCGKIGMRHIKRGGAVWGY